MCQVQSGLHTPYNPYNPRNESALKLKKPKKSFDPDLNPSVRRVSFVSSTDPDDGTGCGAAIPSVKYSPMQLLNTNRHVVFLRMINFNFHFPSKNLLY